MRTLHFIQRARSLGFSVEEVRDVLDLWRDRTRTSAAVKALATRHLQALDRKIRELESMRRTVANLVRRCRGDTPTARSSTTWGETTAFSVIT